MLPTGSMAHRSDDLNMRSTWFVLTNDNRRKSVVLISCGGVKFLISSWPDILIGAAMPLVLKKRLYSAARVFCRTAEVKLI